MRTIPTFVMLVLVLTVSSLQAESPIPVAEVATLELITAELESQLEKLGDLLKDPEEFDENQEKIAQSGGVIACVSQALVEHPDRKRSTCAGPALRDAGISLQEASEHKEAKEALALAQSAWKGESADTHEELHPWDELVDMYSMMEEMEHRNGGLSRSLRKPRGRLKEKLNASTNAILGLAMLADHNYVDEEEQEKVWDKLSHEYLDAMKKLTKAIGEKDRKQIEIYYKAGNHACDKCHETFRD